MSVCVGGWVGVCVGGFVCVCGYECVYVCMCKVSFRGVEGIQP